jgi:hypothetical protein
MLASKAMKSDYPYLHSAKGIGANSRIRSVALDICMRYGAAGVLGIGQGALPLCLDLHSAGYTVAVMNPNENSTANPGELTPAYRFHSPIIEFGRDQTKTVNFNMAIIIESGKPFLNLSTLIEFATSRLQSGSVILLSIPYHSYLKNLLITMSQWWNLFYPAARLDNPMQYWSRKNLKTLLELNGLSIIEHIGVRSPSLQWEALIIVARKS